MSIPKSRRSRPPDLDASLEGSGQVSDVPPGGAGSAGGEGTGRRRAHYFDAEPAVASRPHFVKLRVGPESTLDLLADRGVFGFRRLDAGTMILLREAPAPPASGEILDLGSGYGPIAIALARAAPRARVWAIDVNERAVELTRANATAAGVTNVTACLPDEVPAGLRFSAIYSNPPVRIGKQALHEVLERWLGRLLPGGRAYLVVQRNLGSDSLAAWLGSVGYPVERLKSKKGYRILAVGAREAAATP